MQEQNEMFEFDYTGLIARISDVLGKESYLSFATRAGMSDTAFKRYIINGTVPPVVDILLAVNGEDSYGG